VISTEDIFSRVSSLPTLPASVARLAVLLGDERAGIPEFEAVIRPDPALTTNLLRMANSAYFGCRREILTVSQAVSLMGLKRVFEVASSAAFTRVIPPRLPGYEMDAQAFWTHSIAVAALTERLGREVKAPLPALAFTAGLLHDVGKLAIGSFLCGDAARVRARLDGGRMSFVNAEREVLGIDHAEVGFAVAERWGLPPVIGATARWHHEPAGAPDAEATLLASLVHAADCLAHSLGFGADFGELRREVDRGVSERLDLRASRLERVAGETVADIHEMARLMASPSEVRA
jgi:putative nucleotidyltransferase with HDIG domain